MRCASTGAPILWLLRGCQICKIPGSVWPANTKPALWMIWWPHFLQWGSLPPFHTLLQTSILAARTFPNPHRSRYPAASHSVGKHHFYPLFAQKHPKSRPALCQSPSSPQGCHFQWVPPSKVSSACTAAHSRVCSSSHPSQEKLHALKTPSRPGLRSWICCTRSHRRSV